MTTVKPKYGTYFFILILCLVLLSGGCSPADRQQEVAAAKVTVQAPLAPPSIPMVPLAGEEDVEVIWYQGMDEAMSRILKNEVDVSIIPVNSMAILYNKGADIQLAGVSTWGILYLVSSDPQVNSWADLQGKTVAVGARGFSPDLVFRCLADQNGLQVPGDVEVIYGSSPEIAQLLTAGKITTAVLPEPLLTSVLHKNDALRIVMNLEDQWKMAFPATEGLPQAGLAVSKALIKNNPQGWENFVQRYAQNLADYTGDPGMIGTLEEETLKLPAAVIAESLSRSKLYYRSAGESGESVRAYLEQIKAIDPDAVGGSVPTPDGDFYLEGN